VDSPISQAADVLVADKSPSIKSVIKAAIKIYLNENYTLATNDSSTLGQKTTISNDNVITINTEEITTRSLRSNKNNRILKDDLLIFNQLLSGSDDEIELQLAAARVVKYSHYLNDIFPSNPYDYIVDCLFGPYQFPQTTTFDQSYYADQAEAYLSLGFIMGKEISRIKVGVKPSPPAN
jgi:hypothetical protein